jgi:hypothetical protein
MTMSSSTWLSHRRHMDHSDRFWNHGRAACGPGLEEATYRECRRSGGTSSCDVGRRASGEVGQSPDEVFDGRRGAAAIASSVASSGGREDPSARSLRGTGGEPVFWLRSDGQPVACSVVPTPRTTVPACLEHLLCGSRRLRRGLPRGRGPASRGAPRGDPGPAGEPCGRSTMPRAHADLGHRVRPQLPAGLEISPSPSLRSRSTRWLWRRPAETEAWAAAEPDAFSTPLCHLLRRAAMQRRPGADGVMG